MVEMKPHHGCLVHDLRLREVGERIAALEAVEPDPAKGRDGGLETGRSAGRESDGAASQGRGKSPEPGMKRDGAAKGVDRGIGL